MHYTFHPAAQADHLETVAYYESKQLGLGASYLAEFDKIMTIVCSTPNICSIEAIPDIRRKAMKKFPFTILFRVVSDTVQILAIAHHRRRPAYWLSRV